MVNFLVCYTEQIVLRATSSHPPSYPSIPKTKTLLLKIIVPLTYDDISAATWKHFQAAPGPREVSPRRAEDLHWWIRWQPGNCLALHRPGLPNLSRGTGSCSHPGTASFGSQTQHQHVQTWTWQERSTGKWSQNKGANRRWQPCLGVRITFRWWISGTNMIHQTTSLPMTQGRIVFNQFRSKTNWGLIQISF